MAVNERLSVIFVTAVTALGALTGCTTPAQTPSPTPSESPMVSPTATPLSPAEQDLENAKTAVVKVWAEFDRIANNPTTASIGDLSLVAAGKWLETLQMDLGYYRAWNWTASGDTVVEDLTAEFRGPNERGQDTWTVTSCVDISQTTLVDKDGKSVASPPYRIRHSSTVTRIEDRFVVTDDEATGTC